MRSTIALTGATLLVTLLASPPAAAAQAGGAPGASPPSRSDWSDIRHWDESRLYENTWSARQLLQAEVRAGEGPPIGEVKDIIVDSDGRIDRVVVEVGGFFEVGDQHIGVDWSDVKMRPGMRSIEVPLKEVENGTYSLFGNVPQGEDVTAFEGSWRVNELIGDYVSLADAPRHGLLVDVIFNDGGRAVGVIVERVAGAWGAGGWYGYPYAGYDPGARSSYALPFSSIDAARLSRFDYGELAERSAWMGRDPDPQLRREIIVEPRPGRGGAQQE